MNLLRKHLILFLFILVTAGLHGQAYNSPNMFYEEWYLLNPSAANLYGNSSVMASSNISSSGIEGAPLANHLLYRTGITDNMGAGLRLNRDVRGNFRTTSMVGSYAYNIQVFSEHYVHFGLSLGVNVQNFDVIHIDVFDTEDPLLQGNDYRKGILMNEVGVHYHWKGLQVGAVGSYLLQSNNHFLTYASYKYDIPGVDKLYVVPNILYQNLPEYENQLDMVLKVGYDIFWCAYSYKTNQDMVAAFGLSYFNFDLGYGYKFSNAEMSSITSCANHIFLRYNFGSSLLSANHRKATPWEQ
jgi:type IX secretion system PorP/SprF family membrane protein